MKYNIYTVLNSAYFKFGQILVKSYFKNCNSELLDNFFITNLGLTDKQVGYLESISPKVQILSSEEDASKFKNGVWGEDWHKCIKFKSAGFLSILENTELSCLLIDSDCMFLKDIAELITENDLQIVDRSKSDNGSILASYVFVLNKNALPLIRDWVSLVQEKYKNSKDNHPKESRSLTEIIEKEKNLKIDRLTLNQVSKFECKGLTDETYVVHFKGNRIDKDIESNFIGRVVERGCMSYVKEFLEDV